MITRAKISKFTALTSELRIARILERELTARAEKCSHFELKNITFKENKLPMLFKIVLKLFSENTSYRPSPSLSTRQVKERSE